MPAMERFIDYARETGSCQGENLRGITKRDPRSEAVEDLVQGDFDANRPMEKVLSDITGINCKDGKLYLSATMDCFDGAIVGMFQNKRAELYGYAYLDAIHRYGKNEGMIVHSDHGSQYTSKLFRDCLKAEGAAKPWDEPAAAATTPGWNPSLRRSKKS